MKIKLDENLPAQLAHNLRALGHDVETVPEEGLRVPGRSALVQSVTRVFEAEDVEHWTGCFVVLTERKLRIRRP